MRTIKSFIFLAFFLILAGIFFYKSVIYKYIPFPGDLLVAEYSPWKTYSFLGYNPGSYPSKAQYFDTLRQIYPWRTFTIESFKSGNFPLWNPYNFSGAPLLANNQSAVFYPPNILYFLLGQQLGWVLLVVFQPLFASIFMYLFCRQIKISIFGALSSSIAFAYSLFMSVFIEYNSFFQVILWLPLILYAFEKFIIRNSFLYALLFAASVGCVLLGGQLQLSALVLGFTIIYIFFRLLSFKSGKKIHCAILFTCLLVLGLGISGVQLLPTFELIQLSARVPQSYEFLLNILLIQPYQLVLFLIPDLFGNPATRNYLINDTYPGNAIYVGLIPFIFALFSLVLTKRNYFVNFFFATLVILLMFLVRSPFSDFFYSFNIPLFSTSSPTNAIFLLSFSISILTGYGIDAWRKANKKLFPLTMMIIAGLFVSVWMLMLTNYSHEISIRNLTYSTVIFGIFGTLFLVGKFIRNSRKDFLVIIFILITILDLFYFFQKFNPFVPPTLIFPNTSITTWLKNNSGIDRVWGYGFASIEANFSTQYSFFSPDGYDPLYPKWYGEFIQSARDGKINTRFTNLTRSDAVIVPGFGENDLMMNKSRLKVLNLLGVKYILDRKENASTQRTFPSERFDLVFEQDDWKIFNNHKALPRIFLVSDYKIAKNEDEFQKIFFEKSFNPSKTIILEQDIKEKLTNTSGLAKTQLLSYKSNEIKISTSSNGNRLLFLSDNYFPGWKAFVDAQETKIYRANYSFRAVVVPLGNHIITYRYNPESFSLGLKITIISIILLVIVLIRINKKPFKYES